MKDAKGHGSNKRGGRRVEDSPSYKAGLAMGPNPRLNKLLDDVKSQEFTMQGDKFVPAAHQEGVRQAGSRVTGFPVGGYYATHPETGETLRKADAKYGDLPPRFATSEQAEAWGTKRLRRSK